jgi:hypothetical protein
VSRGGHRRLQRRESSRPSVFFLVALAAGIAVLIWLAVILVRRPVTPPAKRVSAWRTGNPACPDRQDCLSSISV